MLPCLLSNYSSKRVSARYVVKQARSKSDQLCPLNLRSQVAVLARRPVGEGAALFVPGRLMVHATEHTN